MDKLSELSKPVGYFIEWQDEETGEKEWCECSKENGAPLYSQEYVSALIQRAERLDSMLTESVQALKETEQKIAELEQAMHHIHGALLDITVPRSAIAKAAELAVEHANMKEQSNG
ncbi:hypothetical protein ACTVNX_16240 [Serratia nevei]|uniref:hypothetical protein n=1 Tax=Serratia nevei TaxID=2703794 RepID=UPI0018D714DA|nr:hypothetical protein [Serratia marcescens]MBI6131445.1 hypothetical protein [Serratia marcescens]MBN5304141.1 hypothetical protein [Serratia marcescens]